MKINLNLKVVLGALATVLAAGGVYKGCPEVVDIIGSIVVEDDGGTLVVEDAGTPPVDAGEVVVDSGSPVVVDSGSPAVDAGPAPADSGTVVVDAGTPKPDSGVVVPPDAGIDAGTQKPDAGTVADAGSSAPDAGTTVTWKTLTTNGNKILKPDGTVFRGRGANLFDAHSCNKDITRTDWTEASRRIGVAHNTWKMDLVRLNLEQATDSIGVREAYFTGLLNTVRTHRTQNPNLYILVSVWIDPTLTTGGGSSTRHGGPTSATVPLWSKLAALLADEPNVIFGIANEPRRFVSGQVAADTDAYFIANYTEVYNAIRAAEKPGQQHLVTVQGTREFGRVGAPWIGKLPGPNVAVEIHIYDTTPEYDRLFAPATSVPLLIGEFGLHPSRTQDDVTNLMRRAEANSIPYAIWVMHPACFGEGSSAPGTPIIMTGEPGLGTSPMTPTAWGQFYKDWLAAPYGSR